MRSSIWLRCLLLLFVFVTGCSQGPGATGDGSAGAENSANAHPEVVLVDFYAGAKRTMECTGTLVAPRVVLTAAHCADGGSAAYVRAPNANAQSSDASQIIKYYDWEKSKTGAARAANHDIALVTLDQPIEIADYARVQQDFCPECDVVSVSRQGKTLSMSAPMRTSKTTSTLHPTSLLVSQGSSDAGGPVLRVAGDHPYVVGVMTGKGSKTGVGYATRLDQRRVQNFISHIVAITNAKGSSNSSGTTTQSLHFLNTGTAPATAQNPVQPGPAADTDPNAQSPDPTTQDPEVEGGQPPGDDDDDPDEPGPHDGPSHNAGGEYAEDNINVWNEEQNDLHVESGDNYWMGLPTDDAHSDDPENPALGDGDRDFFAMAGDSAFFVDSHGDEDGAMESLPTKADVQDAVDSGKPIVLVVCFAGKADTYGEGSSLATQLANSWGADPANVYGCTGEVGSSGDCYGQWVNANGDVLPAGDPDENQVSSLMIPGVTGVTFTNNPNPPPGEDPPPPPPPAPGQ